jgi:Ser/Thr protein kinase RdoA (MazF antagonist)
MAQGADLNYCGDAVQALQGSGAVRLAVLFSWMDGQAVDSIYIEGAVPG